MASPPLQDDSGRHCVDFAPQSASERLDGNVEPSALAGHFSLAPLLGFPLV